MRRASCIGASCIGVAIFSLLALPAPCTAGGKVGVYGVYMKPQHRDAEDFSRAGWGGGIEAVAPLPTANMLAGVAGFEVINLMSRDREFRDPTTGLRVKQETSQNYYRIFLGPRLGLHGNGFLRPHAGVNLALVIYGTKTDVVIPNDADPEQEIRQDLRHKTEVVFGYDSTVGLELNLRGIVLDGGVRYLSSLAVPQQLGEGSVRVYPEYFQVYAGIGFSFQRLGQWGGRSLTATRR